MDWIRGFWPSSQQTSVWERFRAALGATIGIGLTGFVTAWWMGAGNGLPLLMAPIGASAVLLFCVPASPLAHPWSILGGNTIAALVGLATVHFVPIPMLAVALAVGGAVALMSFLRCTHPPSGAVALTVVLGGPQVIEAGYSFVLVPVLLNSVLLVLVALVYNNATARSYPHQAHVAQHSHLIEGPFVLTDADFDAVLADYGDVLDISRADLEAIYFELRGRGDARRREFHKAG